MKSLFSNVWLLGVLYYVCFFSSYFLVISLISFTYNPGAALRSNLLSLGWLCLPPFFSALVVGLFSMSGGRRTPSNQWRKLALGCAVLPVFLSLSILLRGVLSHGRLYALADFEGLISGGLAFFALLILLSLIALPPLLHHVIWPQRESGKTR